MFPAEPPLVLQRLEALKLLFVPHAREHDEHQDNHADNDCRHSQSRTANAWEITSFPVRCLGPAPKALPEFYWANLGLLASLHWS